jgi:glycosyltransferase involved in cell wall biosynthesis
LYDKGVLEYVNAAREVKEKLPDCVFNVMGYVNVNNPAAVSKEQVDQWVGEQVIHYLGSKEDIRSTLLENDCVVLPSYREGMSKVIMEAASLGLPVIVTDIPGCKELVDDGRTGFLCRVKDSSDLAEKIKMFINLSQEERSNMGNAGREKMIKEFRVDLILSIYKQKVTDIINA